MKNVKRFIAALMAAVVVATLSGISAFATKAYPGVEDASELGYKSYLVFGDSIATGYLSEQSGEDFQHINIAQTLRDGETTTNAYPTMIADALGLDVRDNPFGYFGNTNTQKNNDAWSWNKDHYAFYNYARDGLTSHEFRLLLDPSYYNQMTDEEKNISDNIILDGDFTKRGKSGFKKMQKHIHQDIKQADVFTVWFGSNDLLFYVLQTTLSVVNDHTITDAANAALSAVGMAGALDAVINAAVLVGKLPLVLATMLVQSNKANAAFAENWDAFMGQLIAEKKPEAKIYVGDIYNSNYGLKFTSTDQFRFGELLSFSANEINNCIRNTSKYRSQYTVVHTAGVEPLLPDWAPIDQWQTALDQGYFYTMFMATAHPQREGQIYLANEFVKAMKANA